MDEEEINMLEQEEWADWCAQQTILEAENDGY